MVKDQDFHQCLRPGVDRLPLGAESVTIPLPQFLESLSAHVRHGGRKSLRWCEAVSYRTSDREGEMTQTEISIRDIEQIRAEVERLEYQVKQREEALARSMEYHALAAKREELRERLAMLNHDEK